MKQITIKNFYSYEVQKHRESDGKDILVWGLKDMELTSDTNECQHENFSGNETKIFCTGCGKPANLKLL